MRNGYIPLLLTLIYLAVESIAFEMTSPKQRSPFATRPNSSPEISPSSAMRIPMNTDTHGQWSKLIPGLLNSDRGLDIRFQWSRHDDPNAVSEFVLKETGRSLDTCLQGDLAQSIESFTGFCVRHISGAESFSGRIVASRGKSGTKCPQWHLDHVPVRWIQSLVGPGCEYVDSRDVCWQNINNLDDDNLDAQERNRLLVQESARTMQAGEGEALMLLGKRWNEFVLNPELQDLDPCVHKSPELLPWEGRLLLTMDVDLAR